MRDRLLGVPVNLGIEDFVYADLYDFERLKDLARSFDRFVEQQDPPLLARFDAYRFAVQSGIAGGGLTPPEESEVLIAVSRHLGVFLAHLFQTDPNPLIVRANRDAQVARFKKEFVAKRVAKVQALREDADTLGDPAAVLIRTIAGAPGSDPEYALAVTANRLLDLEREYPRGAKAYSPTVETRAALEQLRGALRDSGIAF